MRTIKSKIGGMLFVATNLVNARKIGTIKKQELGDLMFRGYIEADVEFISGIYARLSNKSGFSGMQRWLYERIGKRCLLVVEQKDRSGAARVVGMNMYYFNRRDIKENTIHEGFVGVLPEAAGQGIATKVREVAIRHFKSAGFDGISTRISLTNTASLSSAQKIGFRPLEEYLEPSTGERRYYMVCKF